MSTEPTIFVLDQNQKTRNFINNLLFSVGYRVMLCDGVDAFLEYSYPGQTGCLIVNLDTMGEGGLELQQTLRERHIALPMIFVGDQVQVAQAVRAMKQGAVDLIEHPMQEESLVLRVVREALDQDQSQRKTREEQARIATCLAVLSEEERELMRMVCVGNSNREIADRLALGGRNLDSTRAQLMEKMGARSLADLVRMAVIAKMAA